MGVQARVGTRKGLFPLSGDRALPVADLPFDELGDQRRRHLNVYTSWHAWAVIEPWTAGRDRRVR